MSKKVDLKKFLETEEGGFFLGDMEKADVYTYEEEQPEVGELAVDMYQTDSEVVVRALIAGVDLKDIDIIITDEIVTIKGKRKEEKPEGKVNYLIKECFWGNFSRTIELPFTINPEKARAVLKKDSGFLEIKVQKVNYSKLKKLQVEEG